MIWPLPLTAPTRPVTPTRQDPTRGGGETRGETRYPRPVPGHYSSYLTTMKMRVGPDTTRTLIIVKKSFLRIPLMKMITKGETKATKTGRKMSQSMTSPPVREKGACLLRPLTSGETDTPMPKIGTTRVLITTATITRTRGTGTIIGNTKAAPLDHTHHR